MKAKRELRVETPSDREVRIVREFDAPRRLVFKAWTTPELVKRWLSGPPGWTMTVCTIDLRVGGAYRFEWLGNDGTEMGMGGVYREVLPPERTVATEQFDVAWYPGEAIVTNDLTEQDGVTTSAMTIRYESPEGRDAALSTGMTTGMEAGYANLDELLASLA